MRVSIKRIQEAVAADFGITVEEMVSPCRQYRVCHPRQYAMVLSRQLTPLSVTVIGKLFDRDHSTVSTDVRSAKKRIAVDENLSLKLGARALLLQSEPIHPQFKVISDVSAPVGCGALLAA